MNYFAAAAQPACREVNFYDDDNPEDNCVWASIHQFPQTGATPSGVDFLAAIPTNGR
jgi:hypothetical protein